MSDSDDEEEETEKIEQIDAGLARYYKRFSKPYDNIFKTYCEDNGFDDESLDEELVELEDVTDCMFINIDAEFPFSEPINDSSQRAAKIVEIIKKCYQDPDAFAAGYKASVPHINGAFFSLNKQDKKRSNELLEQQVNVLYKSGISTEQTILDIIAIGHKNNYPYINYLADLYSREVAEGHIKFQDPTSWLKAHPHYNVLQGIKSAKGIKLNPAELTNGAINSYFVRIVPRLILPSPYKIMDSLESTSKYIAAAIQFTNNLANDGVNLPFQLDVVIGFGAVERRDDDDDDDYDDDDDDNESDDDEKFQFNDVFGDIQNRLNKNKLNNVMHTIERQRTQRDLDIAFKNLKKECDASFPANKRFCTFIDRRSVNESKSNDVFMWESPKDCRDIPNNYVPEWFFNASTASILPHEAYNTGKDRSNTANITAQSKCNGGVFVLSFHVLSVEEIRCYLYVNGQMSRFMPQDIIGLLPQFFDLEYENNKEFIQSTEAKKLIEPLSIPDVKFESFCEYLSKK